MSIFLNLLKAWILGCVLLAIFSPNQDGIVYSFGHNIGASLRFVLALIGVV